MPEGCKRDRSGSRSAARSVARSNASSHWSSEKSGTSNSETKNGWRDWNTSNWKSEERTTKNTNSWSSTDGGHWSSDWSSWGPPKERNYDFPPGTLHCSEPHGPVEIKDVLTKQDMTFLREVWDHYHDNLDCPKLKAKPILSSDHLKGYHNIVLKVLQRVADVKQCAISLDQATISATSAVGHKRHADNLVFGVWRYGRRVKGPVEVEIEEARKDGAEIWWKPNTTAHRNFAITINLVDPSTFEGGTVKFFKTLGAVEPYARYKAQAGCGVTFCGCDECIHEVEGVSKGFRLCLLLWTRKAGIVTPPKSKTTHYHRSGTGDAVWLTLADLPAELQDIVVEPSPSPTPSSNPLF